MTAGAIPLGMIINISTDYIMNINCPFCIGDIVQFTPSERTQGLYQNIKRFGLEIGQKAVITEIRGVYLYFGKNIGGFPWNEFTLVMKGDIK